MRRLLGVATIFVCLQGISHAESKRGLWLRRLTLAASCASSFWDVQTTGTAMRYGAEENNPIFLNQRGGVRWGRMLGVKIAVCGGAALSQELLDQNRRSARADYFWTGINAALALRFSLASVQNRRVAAELKPRPAYLLRQDVK